jgi:rubrerythrin
MLLLKGVTNNPHALCVGYSAKENKTMNQEEYRKIIALAIDREAEAYAFYHAV